MTSWRCWRLSSARNRPLWPFSKRVLYFIFSSSHGSSGYWLGPALPGPGSALFGPFLFAAIPKYGFSRSSVRHCFSARRLAGGLQGKKRSRNRRKSAHFRIPFGLPTTCESRFRWFSSRTNAYFSFTSIAARSQTTSSATSRFRTARNMSHSGLDANRRQASTRLYICSKACSRLAVCAVKWPMTNSVKSTSSSGPPLMG
mmetsp:Transcript_112369/g.195162  ORF Transcript_112369/g.195162 Transcript_112369/m.195162 type:complete len:200 (+) Transcript_112369:1238-1837(+)